MPERTDVGPLAGYTVGITAARRRAELGTALERRGARVQYGPAIRIVPLPDDALLREATEQCIAARLDFAVATTGHGFSGWLDAARSWGSADTLTARLAAATILARGPKARGAVRSAGLREAWSPDSESSAEVLRYLLERYDLVGKRIAVQLHGEPLRDVVDALRAAGAEVIEVPVYRWEPPEDERPLRRLIEATASGAVDAVTFTSAPAATNFLRTAAQLGRADEIAAALREAVLCTAVGPVTAAPLIQAGIAVTQPARARLAAMVRTVVEELPARATVLSAAGHRLELRGHAVLVDDALVALPAAEMSVLRLLAREPGRAVSRGALVALLPGEASAAGAVEAGIERLTTALGDDAIVQPTAEDSYRLGIDTT